MKKQAAGDPLTLDEYTVFLDEQQQQPAWRAKADREDDYADGKQLGSELLQRLQETGTPPAIEDLIGPALLSIQGYEAATRTDWRVTPDGMPGGKDVADALNFKLNQAERHSRADDACSDAFRHQICSGLGFVEVRREQDPFKFPYRCQFVHRNEIHWDMKAQEPDLSDARWLRRTKWLHPDRLRLMFPRHKELIGMVGKYGAGWWIDSGMMPNDGGQSTSLLNAAQDAQVWTTQEDHWYNPESKEAQISEVWYRRWVDVVVIKLPDGRAVEYDEANMAHQLAVASGTTTPVVAIVPRMRRSYWLGPHMLDDAPSPYPHQHFPYVPFFGFREASTGIPYGYVRGMMFAQDNVNSGTARLRWGMAAARVTRTKGAVAMTDAQLRRQIARPDADVVLDEQHMSRPGAVFKVERDFQLNSQHFQLLNDSRAAIMRVSAVTAGFMGKAGTATSGLQEQTQVEQSNQALGRMMDGFRRARSMVGELLLAMIVEDIGSERQVVVIEGDAVREDRTVTINAPETDPDTGYQYLSNDLLRTRLKVSLEDVPSTSSYRAQQLNAMSEAVKALPPQYQEAMLPYLVGLMDVPYKDEVMRAIREAKERETPEQIEQRIKQEVDAALVKAQTELKTRELAMKERISEAEIQRIMAQAVHIGVQAAYSSMQGGLQVAQMPQIAPIADEIMRGAGYQMPTPAGQDPNFPVPAGVQAPSAQPASNTSPAFPPTGGSPMAGIETPTPSDNL